jgi:hypothetical protein
LAFGQDSDTAIAIENCKGDIHLLKGGCHLYSFR